MVSVTLQSIAGQLGAQDSLVHQDGAIPTSANKPDKWKGSLSHSMSTSAVHQLGENSMITSFPILS